MTKTTQTNKCTWPLSMWNNFGLTPEQITKAKSGWAKSVKGVVDRDGLWNDNKTHD